MSNAAKIGDTVTVVKDGKEVVLVWNGSKWMTTGSSGTLPSDRSNTFRDVDKLNADNADKPINFEDATPFSGTETPPEGRKPEKLTIKAFPEIIKTGEFPHILFKIFRSASIASGGTIGNDRTGASIVAGGSAVTSFLDGVPGGNAAAAAALVLGAGGGLGSAFLAAGATTEIGQGVVNDTANNLFGASLQGKTFTETAKDLIKGFSLKRNIDLFETAIALFMPDNITTNYDNEYQALSITSTLGAVGFAAQALATRGKSGDTISPYVMEGASRLASKVVGGDEDFTRLGLFATTGLVNNPQLEMIYNSPVLRKFIFDFRLVPRSDTESQLIKDIIKTFKRESAPIIPKSSTGRYLIPPSQFEISFHNGAAQGPVNDYFFKTKKCVLTGINVDYTPNGYATFTDGAPVETRLQLQFTETAIIDQTAVEEGY